MRLGAVARLIFDLLKMRALNISKLLRRVGNFLVENSLANYYKRLHTLLSTSYGRH